MRRAIIVTNSARECDVRQYEGYHMLVFEDAIALTNGLSNVEIFKDDAVSTVVDATLAMPRQAKRFVEILKQAIELLRRKGYDELTILTSIHSSVAHLMEMMSLYSAFPRLKIMFSDGEEDVSLYREGTFILTKKDHTELDIFPFPTATISIDHANQKYAHTALGGQLPFIANITIVDRLCVLRVEAGTIIVVKKEVAKNA